MRTRSVLDFRARPLLVFLGVCVFLSTFATIDTSEHYRAWRTALGWSLEQKTVASALDVERVYPLVLLALASDTAVIVLSLSGAMALGIAAALESEPAFSTARVLAWAAAAFGIAYTVLMVAYGLKVGSRTVLKGPIFDYGLRLQIPILFAEGGFPVSAVLFGVFFKKNATSKRGSMEAR